MHEDALVARHLVEQRLADGFEVGDDRHRYRADRLRHEANGDFTSSSRGSA